MKKNKSTYIDDAYDDYDDNYDGYQNPKKPRKRRNGFVRFLRALLITISVLVLVAAGGLYAWAKLMGRDADSSALARAIGSNLKDGGDITGAFSGVPTQTNFLILGTDEGGTRTDVMMVGMFDKDKQSLSLLSIPRDTYVTMPQSRRNILTEHNVYPPAPSSGVMKLTEVYHYASEKYGVEYTTKQIEELLGITITYYIKINLKAFRYIVDEIGGVEFDVPQRMYYNDNSQGLHIDLQPGPQTLNGTQAEGLVRYRKSDSRNPISKGYAGGDVQRTAVQQAFVKALISQMLAKDEIIKNAPAMFSALLEYVRTNFNPTELPKYLPHVQKLRGNSITIYTLPGTDARINGKSYFIVDETAATELVAQVFFSGSNADKPASNKNKTIEVLNGGYTTGLAGRTADMLEGEGFAIAAIGDYTGTKTAHTRIFVKFATEGFDLQKLFPGSKIEIKPSEITAGDITIVLGTEAE